LRGAGLGLWGLRPPPLVDRDAERKALWAALGDVASSGEPAAVVLRGPPGVGKSRLAQWVALEGNERGRCHVLRVAHHAVPDDDHGLPGMFRRELRLGGLPREEAVQRIRDHLDLDDGSLDLLATWVLGVARPEDREPSATEKLSLLRRCLAHWAADRPVLVLVDDAHYGAIALRLVSALVRRVRKLPVLFVFALRDDLLVQRPEESRRVDDLLQGPRTSALAVAPLGEDHQRELVRKMLGLEGSLAAEVERRTAGNPAFAVQLVNAWVRSGELEVGPAGFRLKHGLPDELPSDLLAVWTERVASLAEELPFEDMEAFELAAMLGVDVEVRAWRDVCARAGIRLRPGLIGRLVRTYLLKADPRMERVTFAHNGVREALLLRLRAMGREARSAGFAADYLLAHGGDPGRTAELLLASDRLDDATEPLLAIIEDELAQGDLRSSRWLELLEGVLRDLGVPSTDERWGTLWLNWAWLFRLQGKREEADQLAARTEKAARRHGWKAVLGWALSEAGATALDRAEYAEAISFLEEAEGVLREAGRPESAAHCRNRIAVAWESLGRFDRAEQSFRSCLNAFVDNPKSWVFAATPWLGLAQLYQKQGRLDEALDHAAQARVWSERMGQHANLALIELLEGEVARYRGDLVGADDHYRRSAEIYETFHHPMSTVATLNLAVVGVLRGQFAETRAMTESLLASLLEADRRPAFAAYARSVLLACTAALGDQAAFDVHHRELSAFLEATGAAEPDIAKLASIAANRAQTASMQDRALAIQRQQEKRLEKKA
ncbi:MAG: AAA family ATPase, partial [Myxococcales bacterium]|nr:AAA family ATPase [Myxococcales bacterium]